jgi:hypothetical protein
VSGTQCKSFYVCSNGFLNIISCPNGLLFDSGRKICDYSNFVYCSETALATTSGKNSQNQYTVNLKKFYNKKIKKDAI